MSMRLRTIFSSMLCVIPIISPKLLPSLTIYHSVTINLWQSQWLILGRRHSASDIHRKLFSIWWSQSILIQSWGLAWFALKMIFNASRYLLKNPILETTRIKDPFFFSNPSSDSRTPQDFPIIRQLQISWRHRQLCALVSWPDLTFLAIFDRHPVSWKGNCGWC